MEMLEIKILATFTQEYEFFLAYLVDMLQKI